MQMSARNIIAIIAACSYFIGVFATITFGLLMMEEVDRKRPDLNLYSAFSKLGSQLDRGIQLYRLYRSLYPNGKLHIYEMASFAVVIVSMIVFLTLMAHFNQAIR
jgi:hypothetical protein